MADSSVHEASLRLRLPLDETRILISSPHDWVVLSGKMACGKDTVAAALSDSFYGGVARILRYGDLMRVELARALDAWRAIPDATPTEAASAVCDAIDLPEEYGALIVEELHDDMRESGFALTPWDRTNGIRVVLQSLGGPWRTEADDDYWARAACIAASRARCDSPVILTGGRFHPDVEIPALLGAAVIRIDVSERTQLERLRSRDGLVPDPATLVHPGEVLLDDWPGFTGRVDGNCDIATTVAAVEKVIRAHRAASRRQAVTRDWG